MSNLPPFVQVLVDQASVAVEEAKTALEAARRRAQEIELEAQEQLRQAERIREESFANAQEIIRRSKETVSEIERFVAPDRLQDLIDSGGTIRIMNLTHRGNQYPQVRLDTFDRTVQFSELLLKDGQVAKVIIMILPQR